MHAPQSQKDLARQLLKSHGIMRLSELKAQGIHPPTLSSGLRPGQGRDARRAHKSAWRDQRQSLASWRRCLSI